MFVVMRMPCLMEDEGRPEYNGSFPTKVEAEKHIEKLVKDSKDYFSEANYEIMGS